MGVARGFPIGCLALAALLAVAGGRASAQSYFLDYSGTSGSESMTFMAAISGINCNPSCTLTSPSQFSGTMTIKGTASPLTPGTYAMTFSPTAHLGGADDVFNLTTGVDHNGINFESNIPGEGTVIFNLFSNGSPGTNNSADDDGREHTVNILTGGGNNFTPSGILSYGEPAPAPAVGEGPWSWLAFAMAGLWLGRRTISVRARALFAKLAPSGA